MAGPSASDQKPMASPDAASPQHPIIAQPDLPDPRYRCGTLVYSKTALFTVFAYLLWGDFCFSFMEAVWPSIFPLMLKAEGTPNVLVSLVITTVPSAMNFMMSPIIGTMSDRHRGRRGRRIPFLLAATPFVTLFLVLLGFSRPLAGWLHDAISGLVPHLSVTGVAIGLLCVLMIGFRFFELIVNTIFWYLFNDVVPSAFIGRFLGFFRVIGSLAGALFHFFLFRYAESHTSWIFFGVALLYGTAFLWMCLRVREGEYPPPDSFGAPRSSPLAYIRVFLRECFSHRIFRLVFAYSAIAGVGAAINAFVIFLAFSVGLTLDEVGKIAGVAAFVGVFLMYPMGVLVDRFHPLRLMLVAKAGVCLAAAVQLVFLFFEFSRIQALGIYAVTAGLIALMQVTNMAAALPMYMKIFPHERFGQFCAANAMSQAVGIMGGGALAGLFLDAMKQIYPVGNYYYRFVPVWSLTFMLLALGAAFLVFREWKRLGGDKFYRSPMPDKFAAYHHTP